MANKNDTALLLIDPYNDFLHAEKGKLYPRLAESLRDSDTITHLFEAVQAARSAETPIPIFYCLHQQTNAGPHANITFKGWGYLSASQTGIRDKMVFEEGSFGAKIYEGLEPDYEGGDVVVGKHWGSRYVMLCCALCYTFVATFWEGFGRRKREEKETLWGKRF